MAVWYSICKQIKRNSRVESVHIAALKLMLKMMEMIIEADATDDGNDFKAVDDWDNDAE